MKKITILLLFISAAMYGQLDTIDLRISYFGIPSIPGQADFMRNEAYKMNQSLLSVDSLYTFIDPSDSTGLFTELTVTGHVYEGEHASALTYVSTPGTQTINTGGTFEKLDEGAIAYTGAHLHEFTHSDGRLTYTSTTGISMTINVSVSVESGETAQVIQFRIAKGGSTIAATNQTVTFTAVNKNASVNLFWMVDMAQNEYIEMFGTSDTSSDDIIINNLTMGITKH